MILAGENQALGRSLAALWLESRANACVLFRGNTNTPLFQRRLE
jgi:hypothetical protein